MRALDPSTSSRATRHNTQPSRAVRLMLIPPSLLPSFQVKQRASRAAHHLHRCTAPSLTPRAAALPFLLLPPPSLSPRTLSETDAPPVRHYYCSPTVHLTPFFSRLPPPHPLPCGGGKRPEPPLPARAHLLPLSHQKSDGGCGGVAGLLLA
ncbi:hypothetical protein PR202_gb27073 [Eleusine coracana subsp. coracana]|uniref:Uncharacterized protein n=1 Tax=Eleusine coracana subsp. coracana TaxID=191504 RepID=A0AAV5FUB6_ELECO|nr:hypothetical protein PR202_gb27073 [Eleusine coracana subsp. coracana]